MTLRIIAIGLVVLVAGAVPACASPAAPSHDEAYGLVCVSCVPAGEIPVAGAIVAGVSFEDVAPRDAGPDALLAQFPVAGLAPLSLPAGQYVFDASELPGVPNAMILTLAGLACIALVRDRRQWTAAIAKLVRLTRAGACALPRLAWSLRSAASFGFQTCARLKALPLDLGARVIAPEIEFVGLLRRVTAGADSFETSVRIVASLVLDAARPHVLRPAAFSFSAAAFGPSAERQPQRSGTTVAFIEMGVPSEESFQPCERR